MHLCNTQLGRVFFSSWLLIAVLTDLWLNLSFRVIQMPRETELLHTETRLASLIKLVVAWLSHKRSTSLRTNTKPWCQKPQSRKAGFAWPLIWVAIDIPSTHCSTKRNGAKEPSFFHINTTGHWVQNKATNKNECCEGRGKIAIDMLGQTWRK